MTGGAGFSVPSARQLVRIGFATLILGDCLSIISEIGNAFDAVISDPPYGIGYKPSGPRNSKWKNVHSIAGDDMPFDPTPILSLGKPTVLFGANNFASRLPNSRHWFVWDKRPGMKSMCFSDCELAWCSVAGPARMIRYAWSGAIRGPERKQHWHPTQKPIAVMQQIIESVTETGDTILDPYMGSGSTAVAAHRSGRRFIGIEIEQRWFEAAIQRLQLEQVTRHATN